MHPRLVVSGLLVAASMTISTAAWACSAVGPNKHVGLLLGVDQAASSFTVLDAETNRPITFLADEQILADLNGAKGQVLVDFEAEGSILRATNVDY